MIIGILRTVDEIAHWRELEDSSLVSFKSKDRASAYNKQFKTIEDFFKGLENHTLETVLDTLPRVVDILDAIWGITDKEPMYSEERMKHFIEIIGTSPRHKIVSQHNKCSKLFQAETSVVSRKVKFRRLIVGLRITTKLSRSFG